MKLNFSLFVSALASPRVVNVEDHITRADQVLTGGFGTYLECPYGRVMRGTCTSGNDKESLNQIESKLYEVENSSFSREKLAQ